MARTPPSPAHRVFHEASRATLDSALKPRQIVAAAVGAGLGSMNTGRSLHPAIPSQVGGHADGEFVGSRIVVESHVLAHTSDAFRAPLRAAFAASARAMSTMKDGPMPHEGMLCHAVHFYRDLDSLSAIVSRFIVDGMANGEPAVVIARLEVRQRVEAGLEALGIDVGGGIASRRLLMVDAATALEAILVDGVLDPTRARQNFQSWCERMDAGPSGGTIRFYGEMADLLWQTGQRLAALELEELGNTSSSPGGCIVLCGYAVQGLHEQCTNDDICAFHSHILSKTGDLTAIRA